jgi:hypothetical protein
MRLGLVLATLAMISGTALADSSVNCTVTEMRATQEKKGVEGRLARFKAKLTRAPFTSWDTFSLIEEQTLTAQLHQAAPTKLQSGTITLLYKDMLSEKNGRPRLRFGVDVDDAAGNRIVSTTVVFDSGDGVLIAGAGQKAGATHIIALGCTAP